MDDSLTSRIGPESPLMRAASDAFDALTKSAQEATAAIGELSELMGDAERATTALPVPVQPTRLLRRRSRKVLRAGRPLRAAKRQSFRAFWRAFCKERPTDLPRAARRQIALAQWHRRNAHA